MTQATAPNAHRARPAVRLSSPSSSARSSTPACSACSARWRLIWIGFPRRFRAACSSRRATSGTCRSRPPSVAIMATGMVLVIVTRNIDLSVGSMLGFIGMVMGVAAGRSLPRLLGFEHPATWILTPGGRLVRGVIGAVPGLDDRLSGDPLLHRDARRPAGLARRRLVGDHGQTVAPMDSTFQGSSAAASRARSARTPPGLSPPSRAG